MKGQLEALLAKGWISPEAYDRLTASGKTDVSSGFKILAKDAKIEVDKFMKQVDDQFGTPYTSNAIPTSELAQPAQVQPEVQAAQPQGQSQVVVPPARIAAPTASSGVASPKPGQFLTSSEKARMEELGGETANREKIAKESTDLMMKQEAEVGNVRQKQAVEYEAMVKNNQELRNQENSFVQDNITKLEREADDLKNKKVDPKRAFNTLSTGNKITAALGLVFGAFGTKKGGANQAMETINKFIDRDIMAQEMEIRTAGAALNTKRGLLSDRMQQFNNLELARQAAKKDYLDVVEMQVKGIIAKSGSDKVKLQGEEVLASLNEAKSKTLFDFAQLNDQRAKQAAAQAAARKAAADARLYDEYKAQREHEFKMEESQVKANTEYAKEQRSNRIEVTGMDGNPVVLTARNPKAAETISEAEVARQRLKSLIAEARQLRASVGGEWLPTAEKARMQQIQADMLGEVKSIDKLGTLDKGVERLGEKLIPDLTSWNMFGNDKTLVLLDGLEKKADNNLKSVIKSNTVPGSTPQSKPTKTYGFKPNE
jgi:hypothetical protein